MEISTKKISYMRLSFETQLFTSGKKKCFEFSLPIITKSKIKILLKILWRKELFNS